jgi:hypothetical protein
MTTQPDKLFRDKLENYTRSASADAWSRIETGLNKSKPKMLWLKIAASITVVGITATLFWPSNNTTGNLLVVSNKHTKSTPERIKQSNTIETQPEIITEIIPVITSATKPVVSHAPIAHVEVTEESIQHQELLIETETVMIAQAEVETYSTKTIMYSADEVNAKFLKKEIITEATSEEKKTSGIQKLIGAAYNLASVDTGLGELRQRKDEVLALNFKDKKQGQN